MNPSVIFKSILHNIGVILVGFIFAFVGSRLDLLLGLKHFKSFLTLLIGISFLIIGFLLRVWATYYFYKYQMRVIDLKPQKKLITSGPYHFSRNPLYLGGNVFIFLGASLVIGTPMGVIVTFLHLPVVDVMIRREEKQLEKVFGKEWIEYKKSVRRWF